MNAQELLEEWTTGESTGMRAARVQTLRDDLKEATGQSIPRRIPDIEALLNHPQWKGTITQKLREEAGVTDDDDTDSDDTE